MEYTMPTVAAEKTRLSVAQILYCLQRRCGVGVTAKFDGGLHGKTLLLQRQDERPLRIAALKKVLGLAQTEGWIQMGKMVEVPIRHL